MPAGRTYRFVIDAWTPATLPMKRLAQYMAELATMLGEPDKVHFSAVEDGSATIAYTIEEEAIPKVLPCLRAIQEGKGPRDAMKAHERTAAYPDKDRSSASLIGSGGDKILQFPCRESGEPVTFGPL